MPRAVRYRILRKIAHGGMAEIFLAMQTGAEGFQKPVVLKRILPAFAADPHFVRMLVDEAHIASTLNHSHLVQILDLGKSGGQFFLVLEFVDGWSLEQVRRRAQKARLKFPLPLTLYVVSSLCRALSYVHRRSRDGKSLGIVHRDVSPQNVLLGREGEVKLADFGIAKAVGRREKSATGIIKGKFAYMSPEQSIGSALDARSDLFSVGTLLYILTTGKKPFDAPTDLEVLMQVRRARFEKPTAFLKEFNPEVERFIGRALRADRSRRWQSAEQMADRLDAILVKLGQPSGPAALKRWLEALSARDGIQPPGEMPDVETELGVGTIELETGDLEAHDSISGELAVAAPARAPRRQERAASAVAASAAASTSVGSSPSASASPTTTSSSSSSSSGSNYVSLSIVPAEAADAPEPAASPASPAVASQPITRLVPPYIPAEARQPEPTVRRTPLFVLGEPMFPLPQEAEEEEEAAAADEPDDPDDDTAPDDEEILGAPDPTATAIVDTPPPGPVATATVERTPLLPVPTATTATPPLQPITPAAQETPPPERAGTPPPLALPTIRYPIVFPPVRTFTRPSPVVRPSSPSGALSGSPAAPRALSGTLASDPDAGVDATLVEPPALEPVPEPEPDDRRSGDVEPPAPRLRRWRRRLLIALASFTLALAVLGTGAYTARAYVIPSWPPWAFARLIRPVEGWLRGLPARLHLGAPAEQRNQQR
jgi:serine/threonine-protein kinase